MVREKQFGETHEIWAVIVVNNAEDDTSAVCGSREKKERGIGVVRMRADCADG